MGLEARFRTSLIIGLLVDALLVGAGSVICVLVVVIGSEGKCPSFFSFIGGADCTVLHYAAGAIILMLRVVFRWWWIVLPALLIPPAAAFWLGRGTRN
jgi:hypothetical protein